MQMSSVVSRYILHWHDMSPNVCICIDVTKHTHSSVFKSNPLNVDCLSRVEPYFGKSKIVLVFFPIDWWCSPMGCLYMGCWIWKLSVLNFSLVPKLWYRPTSDLYLRVEYGSHKQWEYWKLCWSFRFSWLVGKIICLRYTFSKEFSSDGLIVICFTVALVTGHFPKSINWVIEPPLYTVTYTSLCYLTIGLVDCD